MPIVGFAKTFDKKFAFTVEVFGFTSAGFMKCSALEAEVNQVTYYEGGALTANKSAGRLDFKDITLERGATRGDIDALAWFAQVASAPLEAPMFKEPFYKRSVDIVQRDRTGEALKRWTLVGAWPKQFTAGEWDNTVDETVIEKLVLAYDFFIRRPI